MLDLIVPAHRGFDALKRCIESVWSSAQQTPFEVVVVDDASPEPELVHWLRSERDRGRLTLLQRPSHDGFATSVNQALSLHPDRDVEVLGGDVEVAGDWLDRLATHAGKGRDVGAVMPFTGDGSVAGYPQVRGSTTMPDGHTAASLDLLFKRANTGISMPVPFVRGPCVYLRRECLRAAGVFDGSRSANGDEVEQEFGLRASSAGFRHLLATDVFVRRDDASTFARSASQGSGGREALDKRYPQYSQQCAEFLATDPSRPFRRRVDLLRLAESPKHIILFIALAWGGGIRRHMAELAKLVADRCNVLLLEPALKDSVKLSWFGAGEDFSAWFSLPDEMEVLAALLRSLGVARIHIHHVHALPRSVLELPRLVGVPYDCTLHDYYAICPQYHLVTEHGHYCGEPDAAGCAACLAKRPGQWDLDIVSWRGVFGQILRGAERVIAPSRDVARRIGRYLPDVKIAVLPHPEEPVPPWPRFVRIVTLGSLSPQKGLGVLAACANDAQARKLALSFRVLGPTTEPVPKWPSAPISVHGEYPDGELPRLLAAENADVIWFPAQVPETYSYTLSVAMSTGLPIVASDLGALSERLANYPQAIIVPWNAPAERWNDILSNVGEREHADALLAPARLALS